MFGSADAVPFEMTARSNDSLHQWEALTGKQLCLAPTLFALQCEAPGSSAPPTIKAEPFQGKDILLCHGSHYPQRNRVLQGGAGVHHEEASK